MGYKGQPLTDLLDPLEEFHRRAPEAIVTACRDELLEQLKRTSPVGATGNFARGWYALPVEQKGTEWSVEIRHRDAGLAAILEWGTTQPYVIESEEPMPVGPGRFAYRVRHPAQDAQHTVRNALSWLEANHRRIGQAALDRLAVGLGGRP